MTDYAALKKAGAPILGWGEFLTQVVSFLILAFIIFLMVRWATKLMRKARGRRDGGTDRGRAAGRNQGRAEAALGSGRLVRTRPAVRRASEILEPRIVAQRVEIGIEPKILDHRGGTRSMKLASSSIAAPCR